MTRTRTSGFVFGVATAVALALGLNSPTMAANATGDGISNGVSFYVPGFQTAARQQWAGLVSSGDTQDAALIAAMEQTSHGVWVIGGSPNDARVKVLETANVAAGKSQVPVYVAYNIPGRDCGGFSAGGAQTTAQYEAWIDGFAAGLAGHQAVVILEPDGLGLLPSNCGGPNSGYPFTDGERYAELKYAVDRLATDPQATVYLDGTHSGWLSVGDAASRLVAAGVRHARGFFLNVSNYQFTANLDFYGTWISDCITYATVVNPGAYGACPNQYWNGGPPSWVGTAMSPYGVWSDTASEQDLNTSGVNARYAGMLGTTAATTHFVVDTSRNGRGPWKPPSKYPSAGAAQDWCNPPLRGLGHAPTDATAAALDDAYLWVKVPGESDGSCNRGSSTTVDPEWAAITGNPGFVDPAAGQWFPEQALQLAHLARPALQ